MMAVEHLDSTVGAGTRLWMVWIVWRLECPLSSSACPWLASNPWWKTVIWSMMKTLFDACCHDVMAGVAKLNPVIPAHTSDLHFDFLLNQTNLDIGPAANLAHEHHQIRCA